MYDVAASVESLDRLARAWALVSTRPDWVSRIGDMRAAQQRIVDAGGWTTGPSTLIDVLGLTSNEVLHCRVLRWLLDPLARHGVGTLLVSDLLKRCELDEPQPERSRVTVEETRGQTRADIIVTTPNTGGVIIEAKVYATEGAQQGERIEAEWHDAERLVFLTIHGERLPDTSASRERWLPLSWGWFAERTRIHLDATGDGSDIARQAARHAASEWTATVLRNFT
jgi:hypothetical protein